MYADTEDLPPLILVPSNLAVVLTDLSRRQIRKYLHDRFPLKSRPVLSLSRL